MLFQTAAPFLIELLLQLLKNVMDTFKCVTESLYLKDFQTVFFWSLEVLIIHIFLHSPNKYLIHE